MGGTENAKAEACQQEDALGKQWWRLAMQHMQHWVGQRGHNRNLSHVAAAPYSYHFHQFELCSTTRQMRENKVLDVNEALTFTVIDSRNTKLSQHNRRIGMHSHLATNTTACTSHTNHIPWSSHSPYWTLAPNIIKESSGHSPPPST